MPRSVASTSEISTRGLSLTVRRAPQIRIYVMTKRSAWGLMQIRGMGTAYYLVEDGSWIANHNIRSNTKIRLWPERGQAEAEAKMFRERTEPVEWHADEQGKPIFYGQARKR